MAAMATVAGPCDRAHDRPWIDFAASLTSVQCPVDNCAAFPASAAAAFDFNSKMHGTMPHV